ncbi:hypothetical protein C8J57DRAFT_1514350 [Mycena rebaudengoi]|nr:hypothetical protein C8J57DRAFT_1514350 [Mycena rebaudengoi]
MIKRLRVTTTSSRRPSSFIPPALHTPGIETHAGTTSAATGAASTSSADALPRSPTSPPIPLPKLEEVVPISSFDDETSFKLTLTTPTPRSVLTARIVPFSFCYCILATPVPVFRVLPLRPPPFPAFIHPFLPSSPPILRRPTFLFLRAFYSTSALPPPLPFFHSSPAFLAAHPSPYLLLFA